MKYNERCSLQSTFLLRYIEVGVEIKQRFLLRILISYISENEATYTLEFVGYSMP
jgi:hypothetical protein